MGQQLKDEHKLVEDYLQSILYYFIKKKVVNI